MIKQLSHIIGMTFSLIVSWQQPSLGQTHLNSSPAKKLVLITAESPPFMSESLKEQGAGVYAMRKVFESAGYQLEVRFAPWTRAKIIASTDSKIDGLFPSAAQDMKDQFVYSHTIYEAPWVIIQRKNHPLRWHQLQDLSGLTMGNVTGVELRSGIKELAEQKKIFVENTTTDNFNLLKLANKRVDFITMDAVVFRYQMLTEESLRPFKDLLRINSKPVFVVKYGLALKKTPDNEKFLKIFNKVSSIKIMNQHIDYYLEHFVENNTKELPPTSNDKSPVQK